MPSASHSMLILIVGPYRTATGDDPVKLKANVQAMERFTLPLFRAGHIPIVTEWLALPVIRLAGSQRAGDTIFNDVFHTLAERLISRGDAVLRVGGPSEVADEVVQMAEVQGLTIFYRIEDIPGCL